MSRFVLIALVLVAGCDRKSAQGLPPAQDWSTAAAGTIQPGDQPANSHSPHNPHGAGMTMPSANADQGDMPDDETHAALRAGGGDMPDDDTHAAVRAGGGMPDDQTHAGVHAGGAMPVLPPPDPDRPIDPAHRVKGTITVHPKAKDRTPLGGTVFLVARAIDESGQPRDPPLAVQKLTWNGTPIPFELTEINAMTKGTSLTGEVIVTARYDHDGDASSKQPGDVVGTARVKVPSDDVKIFLDDILP